MSEQQREKPKLTEEEKKKLKEEAKNAKAQKKAERLAARQQQQQASTKVEVTWDEVENGSKMFGTYPLIQSTRFSHFSFVDMGDLSANDDGKEVAIRARIHTIRGKGKSCFLLLRQGIYFVQAVLFQTEATPEGMVKYVSKLSKETIVDIVARVSKVQGEISSATQKDIELKIIKCYAVSQSAVLPLLVEDAMRGGAHDDEEIDRQNAAAEQLGSSDKKTTDLPKTIGQENRLNNRVIDMRAPAQLAVFKIQSAMGRFFREFLYANNFTEIHTPKLISAASEGGADVFEVKYFGGKAFLAQSPQLYKQMAVNGDLMRVFEIGPVFRAENSQTHRHLTEFVGLDLEMAINSHYSEVLDLIDQMFIYIFNNIEKHFAKELATIQTQYPFEPLVYNKEKNLRMKYPEAVQLLRENGVEIDDLGDIDTPTEKLLGKLVKQKYNTDLYFLEKYPMSARPFYTMPCPDDPRYSNSYDIFLRGEEISSGAQRIHDPDLLLQKAREKNVDLTPIMAYVDAFKYGAYPHAGCGIGLERIVMLYLGIGNVRKTSMFPRDPKRLTP
jgi:nondiscriminating aspartyl-tRNA synthetase